MNPNSRNGFKKGNKPHNFKGGYSSYSAVHGWLRYQFGSANMCESETCSGISKKFDWALVKGKEYDHKRENFIQMCRSCHMKYDCTENYRQKIRKIALEKGFGKWMLGRKLSEETRRKMSERWNRP